MGRRPLRVESKKLVTRWSNSVRRRVSGDKSASGPSVPERIDIGTRCVRFWDASRQLSGALTRTAVRVSRRTTGWGREAPPRLEFCEQ